MTIVVWRAQLTKSTIGSPAHDILLLWCLAWTALMVDVHGGTLRGSSSSR